MLFRMLYDERLAQAAYLIGCQRSKEAIVIDPERDVDRYIDLAAREGLRIVAVAETHIHADFLSGVRELAERTGAKVYVSDEGGPDWTYRWLDARVGGGVYPHVKLKDKSTFKVGNIEFTALHTPGHTPEHVSYLVTDRGGGATEPMGIATGDFVFVGDLGRPDLLETAAGVQGAKEPSARRLFQSLRTVLDLPDHLQVWPGHGAGSACGKALGAVPQSTIGYERRHNAAILAATSERAFVDFILEGQPEPPMYFARMKRQNRDGPRVLGSLPRPRRMTSVELGAVDGRRMAIVDTRPWAEFRAGHVKGSLFAPPDNTFPMVAGSYIGEDEEIVLIAEEARVEEAVRDLVRIGLDRVVGWAPPGAVVEVEPSRLAKTEEVEVEAAARMLEEGKVTSLDVRRASEFAEGSIPGAMLAPYTRLPEHLGNIPRGKPILVNCRSGQRSARACAYLERMGHEAINLRGGFLAWELAQSVRA